MSDTEFGSLLTGILIGIVVGFFIGRVLIMEQIENRVLNKLDALTEDPKNLTVTALLKWIRG